MNSAWYMGLALCLHFFLLPLHIHAMGSNPSVSNEKGDIEQGMYRVILYGYTYADDPLAIAVLDRQDDAFTFQAMAHKSKTETENDLDAADALRRASWHVTRHSDNNGAWLNKITDKAGRIIGYEVKPVYHNFRFGLADIIDTHYWFEDSTVYFSVDYQLRLRKRFRRTDEYY